ncbi:FAD-dependent monooxygenase [Allopusillimonas soli]|uniref:FAD-dependent monooxygenase n=1 Tax=Allopusillimonas soli TaxID=659016 RepID=A0A853F6D1_9BURK|nr:NAD(P)/FAD-dependent oxidoreductase [Allopusillimonas soli]NYT36124.1 FAD-dependent monooxygenase [Allopusillimonas soli]TEA76459.1 FAD-dependent monooxygenase [Allopusillimonas soli]
MLNPSTISEQYAQAAQDDLKVLIVGAGVAGITLAQLLREQGHHPVLIERNNDDSHPGYMLALMPMVDDVFMDLRLRDIYRARSVALRDYGFHAHRGAMMRIDSLAGMLECYGDYRGIARGTLLSVLTDKGCDVTFGATVKTLQDHGHHVAVQIGDDRQALGLDFDLVVIADGIHSSTRALILGDRKVATVDTGWGGWVVWVPGDNDMALAEELWGAGFFYGVYPVKGKLGVFLGGDIKDTRHGPQHFIATVRKKLTVINPRMERCLQAIAAANTPFFWPLTDCRSPQWSVGRTVLLGDAAAGFLPTAGIGAGMAMESAWVLAGMLRHENGRNLAALLRAYESAQRPRVEAAQDTSRSLARLMFRQSRILAVLRDAAMRFVSVEAALRPIQKLLANKPDPDEIAKGCAGCTAVRDQLNLPHAD